MISPQDNKENVINNYNVYQKKGLTKSDFIEDDLGCVSLSESEDEIDEDVSKTGLAVTEEFLDQAEKCLMDIEKFEKEEDIKMELINLLYQHLQLQKQGSTDIAPVTYTILKQRLAPPDKYIAKSVVNKDLDAYIGSYKKDNEEEDVYSEECGDEAFDFPDIQNKAEQSANVEDIAIEPKKTFQEILEEELRKEEFAKMMQEEESVDIESQLMPPPANPKKTSKRKFLKRGEGIARFSGAPARKPLKQKMKPELHNAAPKRTVGVIRSAGSSKDPTRPNKLPSKIKMDDHVGVVPSKDPAESYKNKTVMSPVRKSPEPSNFRKSPEPRKSPQPSVAQRRNNATEISGFLNPDQVEEQQAAAAEELEEFELLEQAAANKSINSLVGMLKFAAVSNTVPQFETIEEEGNESSEQLLGTHERKHTRQGQSEKEEHEEERDDDDDFDDNETWGFNTPRKAFSNEMTESREFPVETFLNEMAESGGVDVCFDDRSVDRVEDVSPNNGEIEVSQPSKLLGSLFPGLKPPPPLAAVAPDKKSDFECDTLKASLKTKLAELEKEVARFQQEAASLARARTEKESELRKLREENDKYVADLDEKEKKFQEFKDSELKVIRAEKKQFEMTQLSAKQRAAKLELVDSLTARVASLEEELTRKEERWNCTFTRLKDKAEAKEQECEGLHKQITVLEQDKLAMWEKEVIRSSNKRHKPTQTDVQSPSTIPEVMSMVAMPTVSENTIKPALVQRHPALATLDLERNSVKFDEPECVNPYADAERGMKKVGGHVSNYDHMTDTSPRPSETRLKENLQEQKSANKAEGILRESSVIGLSTNHEGPIKNSATQNGPIKSTAVETINQDGSVKVTYSNGTHKHISADGRVVTMTYFNGDTKQTFHDGRVVYKFLKDGITQTQLPSGVERTLFPTGQEESKFPDGRIEIKYPDKSTKITYANGEEKTVYVDGTVTTLDSGGQRLISLPNGQQEVHTSAFKRREYPDGTSKTVFSDGRQETRHSNGRVRKKDAKGNLVSDVMLDAGGTVLHDFLAKSR